MVRMIHHAPQQDPCLGSSAGNINHSGSWVNHQGNDYLSQFSSEGGHTNNPNSSHSRPPSSLPPSSDDSFMNNVAALRRIQDKQPLSQVNSLSTADLLKINWVEVDGGLTKEQVIEINSAMEGLEVPRFGKGRQVITT